MRQRSRQLSHGSNPADAREFFLGLPQTFRVSYVICNLTFQILVRSSQLRSAFGDSQFKLIARLRGQGHQHREDHKGKVVKRERSGAQSARWLVRVADDQRQHSR